MYFHDQIRSMSHIDILAAVITKVADGVSLIAVSFHINSDPGHVICCDCAFCSLVAVVWSVICGVLTDGIFSLLQTARATDAHRTSPAWPEQSSVQRRWQSTVVLVLLINEA